MNQEDFKGRTKALALRIVKLIEELPKSRTSEVMSRQLLRCGTSVGANYRAACRARSTPDFISKMGVVEEEVDETMYWLELLKESGQLRNGVVDGLSDECRQLLAMTIASIKTARQRK